MAGARAWVVVVAVAACMVVGVGAALAEEAAAPKVPTKDLEGGFVALDLTEVCNSDGITSEDNRSDSDFDEWKQSFAADELPETGKIEAKEGKVAFLFPTKEAGKKNNVACKGQKIPVSGKAAQLHLLATATDANQEAKITIVYTDGEAKGDLKVTDWCQAAAFGEKTGVVCPSRVAIGAEKKMDKESKETHLWVVSIPLDAQRELKEIVLPDNAKIHIFAITLAK